MIKIDRRGYKRHVRMLCLTTERVYIITKKDPYPKEAVFLKDILGISCSPLRDGFICLHTRETDNDRVRRSSPSLLSPRLSLSLCSGRLDLHHRLSLRVSHASVHGLAKRRQRRSVPEDSSAVSEPLVLLSLTASSFRCAHTRRNLGERTSLSLVDCSFYSLATLNDECYIEVQPAETFRIACKGFDTLVIVSKSLLTYYFSPSRSSSPREGPDHLSFSVVSLIFLLDR